MELIVELAIGDLIFLFVYLSYLYIFYFFVLYFLLATLQDNQIKC